MMKKIEAASDLYEDFSGHRANTIEKRQLTKSGVFLKIGTLDFLTLDNGQKIKFDPKSTELLATYNGKEFHALGKDIKPAAFKSLGVVKIRNIGYTTRRDGMIEKYIHTFKLKARPQLMYLTRNHLQSLGGVFDFTELGFVDR